MKKANPLMNAIAAAGTRPCPNSLAKLALLLGGMGLSALAQGDNATVLPTVNVRDNQAQLAPSNEIGQNTSLIRADLEAGGKADLHSGLRNQSGLVLTQAGQGTTSGISLRGASGGQGLVTLDGIPLFGNFAGFFPLSHFPLDAF
ncbi:TonB-dependent receptor, partial [Methylogaea oryzae]